MINCTSASTGRRKIETSPPAVDTSSLSNFKEGHKPILFARPMGMQISGSELSKPEFTRAAVSIPSPLSTLWVDLGERVYALLLAPLLSLIVSTTTGIKPATGGWLGEWLWMALAQGKEPEPPNLLDKHGISFYSSLDIDFCSRIPRSGEEGKGSGN
jgi:hypothetical protein